MKGVVYYGVEIWGYREWKEIEALQEKYVKWILGLERTTLGYIAREELKRSKLKVETGWRAGRFEEKQEKGKGAEIGKNCMVERRKDERGTGMNKWMRESIERRDYLWRGEINETALNEWGENKWEKLRERDIEVNDQERGEKVRRSRSCAKYERMNGVSRYIRGCKRSEGKKLERIARWRCGNEEKGNRYWMSEEERRYRLCGKGKE